MVECHGGACHVRPWGVRENLYHPPSPLRVRSYVAGMVGEVMVKVVEAAGGESERFRT
jgi:hypothetical protein